MLEWFNGEDFSIDKNGYESVSWRNDGSPEGFDAWIEKIEYVAKANKKRKAEENMYIIKYQN